VALSAFAAVFALFRLERKQHEWQREGYRKWLAEKVDSGLRSRRPPEEGEDGRKGESL
jgi:hypothetical protein